jgi:hypothetical protein
MRLACDGWEERARAAEARADRAAAALREIAGIYRWKPGIGDDFLRVARVVTIARAVLVELGAGDRQEPEPPHPEAGGDRSAVVSEDVQVARAVLRDALSDLADEATRWVTERWPAPAYGGHFAEAMARINTAYSEGRNALTALAFTDSRHSGSLPVGPVAASSVTAPRPDDEAGSGRTA